MKASAVERRGGVERRKSNRRKEKDPGKSTKTVPTAQKAILTTREVAEILKVTQQTIKNYIYAGKLKSRKTPGGRHRIYKSDLIKSGYLQDQSSRD
ncbi:helix-turn-helix domain-containing protein [bacterium]|nr:MAG: helix-turn-helix domain-containing protein [bacterium]